MLLACAAVPAARQALHITLPGLRKTAAPQVLQWVRQLLLACPSPAAAGAASQAPGGDATQAAAEEEDGDGSAGLGWEECLALGCALELGALLRAYAGQLEAGRAAPQDGWEDLAKELAAVSERVAGPPPLAGVAGARTCTRPCWAALFNLAYGPSDETDETDCIVPARSC